MKIQIPKSQLLLGLQRAQNVVERKTTMPILSNCLLRTEKSGLSLVATDLEVGIQSLLPAEIGEPGSITVKATSLLEIARELPETSVLLQTTEQNRLEITANRSTFIILGLPAEDFPEVPGFGSEDPQQFIRVSSSVILNMLDRTLYAASTDQARYHLNGIFFETVYEKDEPRLRFVSTDAHRLSLAESSEALFDENAWKKIPRDGVIVPRKGLYELKKLLGEGKEDLLMLIKEKMLYIKRENLFLSMRLIDSKYADYRRIIPEALTQPLVMSREGLLASLKRVSLMSTDKSKSVTLTLLPGLLQLSSQSPELGEAKEEMSIEYEGEELKIGFNSRYLIDAVSAMDGEKIALEVRGKQSPGVIRSTGGIRHISVVMPMRI